MRGSTKFCAAFSATSSVAGGAGTPRALRGTPALRGLRAGARKRGLQRRAAARGAAPAASTHAWCTSSRDALSFVSGKRGYRRGFLRLFLFLRLFFRAQSILGRLERYDREHQVGAAPRRALFDERREGRNVELLELAQSGRRDADGN